MSIIEHAFTVYKIIATIECGLDPGYSRQICSSVVVTQAESVFSHTSNRPV